MKLKIIQIIIWGMGLLVGSGAGAQNITAFSGNGTLSWTNGLTNGTYEVLWASSLTGTVWTNNWSQLQGIQGTQSVFTVSVPMFYRVKGSSFPEVTDSVECYTRYSNALLNAAVVLPEEISTTLRPVSTNTPGTDWRLFTNWVDGTTNLWVRVATMKFKSWVWNNLLTPGAHTMSNDTSSSSEFWVTLCPDVRQLLAGYTGTNRRLRIEKALGLPPRGGSYGVAEFYVDPKYLFRPAVSPDIHSPSAGLAPEESTPYLATNAIQGISPGYVAWFKATYDSRDYPATNSLDNSWPWTRLGYTFDYENCANYPVGLSEYVVPDCSQTNYWGTNLVIPIYVDANYDADSYGQ